MTEGWAAVCARHWNESPVRTSCRGAIDLGRAFTAVIAASEPFRAGTRFRTLPDVRFFVEEGRLRAPGRLLPDANDATVDAYFDRLDHELTGRGYLLTVEQPLLLDFALWSQVRDRLDELWRDNFGVQNRYEMPLKSSR